MFSPFRSNTYRQESSLSIVHWLIISNIAIFTAQNIVTQLYPNGNYLSYCMLSGSSIMNGHFWAFLTHSFFHGGIMHLFLNLLGLYFVGKPLEGLLGIQRFIMVYFGSIALGGLFWTGFHLGSAHTLIGASAGVLGLLIYFCTLFPNQPITVLLFFILPVSIKPKWLALILLGFELFGFFFTELGGNSQVANSSHLGGMLAGFLCFIAFENLRKNYTPPADKAPRKTVWNNVKKRFSPTRFTVNITPKENIKLELDRILDKINTQGFGALTFEEKETLAKAKDLLT